MQKLKQITKTILLVLASAIILCTSVNANAVAKTIQIGGTEPVEGYVSGVKFTTKTTTDGKFLYCLMMSKKTPKNITANLVGELDAGLSYIIANGYPNKSITGDKMKDYYITQTAVWWYLDDTTGSSNLSQKFKTTGEDPYNLRPTIKNLVAKGKEAKKAGYVKPTLEISTSSLTMTLQDGYYISQEISAKKYSNISSYTVSLNGEPINSQIIDANGNKKTTFNVNEKFRVKVPAKNVSLTKLNIQVTAKATGTIYKAYRYQPTNQDMQPVTPALLEKETTTVSSQIRLEIESSKVSIVKIDSTTKKALAGASLVLKDSKGGVIASWKSTTNYHVIRNLKPGTYTITETEAPTGYLLSTKPVSFTVTSATQDLKVKVENTPRVSVVNILKVDKSTGNPLAGAILSVKDSTGKEIAKFTSTTEPYVITDLADGTYTIEEVQAPTGYMLNSEKITFTINSENLSHQIIFENHPEVIVPDTSTSSTIIITLIGIVIIASGISYTIKNGKKASK